MSIVAAKKAAQSGFGDAAKVVSGTMQHDNTKGEDVFTFKALFKGEEAPRQFLFRVRAGQEWISELARRGRQAVEKVHNEIAKEKA